MALSVGTITGSGLRFVRNMILARLLMPEELGVMSIVLASTMALEAFTEVGVKQSVIQNKHGADTAYLNVAWWIQAIRGLGLFAVAVVVAPWISSFYKRPELLGMLRVAFSVILFRSLVSPRTYVLEKEYKFGRAVFLTQGSAILGVIITIVLALMIRNAWALVIGFTAESAMLCLLSYILVPFLPSFDIGKTYLRELTKFACGIFGLPILTMIATKTDVFVLAKVVSGEQLGIYSMALTLAYLPIDLFSKIINPVLLPTFAQKQDDKNALRRVVLQVTRATATFGLPLVAFMTSCASGILILVYTPQYVAATFPFSVLSLMVLARLEAMVLASVYLAVGRPQLHRRFVILRAVIIVSSIYPAILYFGLLGAAVVVTIGNFFALLMQVFWCRRIIDIKFRDYINCYGSGLIFSLPIILTVSLLLYFGVDSFVTVLIIGTFVLLASWMVAAYVLQRHSSLFPARKVTRSNLDCRALPESEGIWNSKTNKMKICLLGTSFDTGNLGVSALAESSIKAILNHWPNAEIILLNSGYVPQQHYLSLMERNICIRTLPIRFSKNFFLPYHFLWFVFYGLLGKVLSRLRFGNTLVNRNPYVRTLFETDLVMDISGGDSFSDTYGLRWFFGGFLCKWLVVFLGKKLIMLPQTYGPFKKPITKMLAKYVMHHASLVYSRDRASEKYIKDLLNSHAGKGKFRFVPDVAFILDARKPDDFETAFLSESYRKNAIVVGLNISGLLFNGGFTKNNMFGLRTDYRGLVRKVVELFMQKEKVVIILIPHVFPQAGFVIENDSDACAEVYRLFYEEYKGRIFRIKSKYNQNEMKYIIGLCEFFIGSRMHSCIAAISQCVPSVGLAYSKKFNGVFESVGMQECAIDMRNAAQNEIIASLEKAFKLRDVTAAQLKKAIPRVKISVLNMFENA
jgi:O-antigen/teichoic acid export membrane protein/polysaccharide pyruvyl transferase WcaK-like protein